jgi:hypothetical protein
MAEDYDNRFDTTFAQVIDAAFDDCLVSERKERLECAHTAGLAGGEENC